MLAELLKQDHGQQVCSGEAARSDMERRRRLRDRLACPARELLAYRLNHLPLPRDHLQRFGNVLAQLRQLRRAAAGTAFWCGDDDALALRQANSSWLEIPCRRAVADASRGAGILSSTIRSFSAADHLQRRPVSTISIPRAL